MKSVRKTGSLTIKNDIRKLDKFKVNAPLVLGNMAVNHFKLGFRRGGFQTDDSKTGWAKRGKGSKRNSGRAILVDSGRLKRSIRIQRRRFGSIIIGTSGIAYANIHNEGLYGKAFGKYRFKMPQREYIGDSKSLERKIDKKIRKMLKLGL